MPPGWGPALLQTNAVAQSKPSNHLVLLHIAAQVQPDQAIRLVVLHLSAEMQDGVVGLVVLRQALDVNTHDAATTQLVDYLAAQNVGHPLRVGIDGRCGSGKSTMARKLTVALGGRGVPAIHLDSDGFHNVRAIRYQQNEILGSARAYYEDAYDLTAVREKVLEPLGPGGSRRYAVAVHNMATDDVVNVWETAPDHAVVIFDCTFLQRGSLRNYWDEVIYLDTTRQVAMRRSVKRDADRLGGADAAIRAHEERYMAACDIYLQEERPVERASILINNDDVAMPRLLRLPR